MTIRTPDDERPEWLYLPVTPGWWYAGATYAGHSSYAVDWNRRTKTGAWVQDDGDPVYAPQKGTVVDVVKSDGLVMLQCHDGLTQVELRHMQAIVVAPGQRVKRGDRIGRIGDVAGSGRSTAPHLHMVQYGRESTRDPFQRVPLTIEGRRLTVSVKDSDTKPAGWTPPAPVLLQGATHPVSWEQAQKATQKALDKSEDRAAALTVQLGAKAEEAKLATTAANELRTALTAANETVRTLQARVDGYITERAALQARIAELEASTDCTTAVKAEHDRIVALMDAFFESVR